MARKPTHQGPPSSGGRSTSSSDASAPASVESVHFSPTNTVSRDAQDTQEDLQNPPSDTDERGSEPTRAAPEPMPHDSDQTGYLTHCTRLIIDGRVLVIKGHRTVYIDTGRHETPVTVTVTNHAELIGDRFPIVCERCKGYGKLPSVQRTGGGFVRSAIPCTDCEGLGAIFREDHDRLLPAAEPRRGRHSNSAQKTVQHLKVKAAIFASLAQSPVSRMEECPRANALLQPMESRKLEKLIVSKDMRVLPIPHRKTMQPLVHANRESPPIHPSATILLKRIHAVHEPFIPTGLSDGLSSLYGRAATFRDNTNPLSPYHTDRYLQAVRDHEQQVRNNILTRMGERAGRYQGLLNQPEVHRLAPEERPYNRPRTARPARLSLIEMNRLTARECRAWAMGIVKLDMLDGESITEPLHEERQGE